MGEGNIQNEDPVLIWSKFEVNMCLPLIVEKYFR